MSQESDGDRRVFTAPPRRVTTFIWSSTWQLTALPPSAHYVLRVITWRSLCAQCADCIRAQYMLLGSDIQKDPERSPCKLSRFITASILPLFELLERDNGVQLALLESLPRYHGEPNSFILRVYHKAKPRRELCACSK